MSKRKVRKDFDKSQPIIVDVSNSGIGEKERVQQAFFDIGIKWPDSALVYKKYKFLDSSYYTNMTYDLIVVDHLLHGRYNPYSNLKCITPKEFFDMVYEDEPQGHPHAELMMQYAEDAKKYRAPWKLWQIRGYEEYPEEWFGIHGHPQWDINMEYRRKPKTHLVHGVEVPDLRINAEAGKPCFVVSPLCAGYYDSHVFTKCETGDDYRWAEQGLCYEHTEAGKQAAILHAKIMLGIYL